MSLRLLDLFCGAGGCTKGYQQAGFHVTGVDILPQPNYCGDDFVQVGALEWLRECGTAITWMYDAIHASPPCQHYANVTAWRGDQDEHPDMVAEVRGALDRTDLPYVMENVREAPLRADLLLCGTALGLRVRRHRHFETNWSGLVMSHGCQHRPDDLAFDHSQERAYADAMGCEWMTVREARQAIPPAYTEHIGAQLRQHLMAVAA